MEPQTGDPLDHVFAALADPTRRAILTMLLEGERTVGEIAAPLPMSLAAASKHVQVLARAGLISQRKAGRERTCRLEPGVLDPAFAWMAGFGGFAADDLARIDEALVTLGLGSGDALDDPLGAAEVD